VKAKRQLLEDELVEEDHPLYYDPDELSDYWHYWDDEEGWYIW